MVRELLSHPLLRFVPLVSILITGSALSFASLAWMRQLEQRRVQLEFDAHGGQIEALVSRRIGASLEVLNSVERFYAASQAVDAGEFELFTRHALENHPGIRFLAWAPRRGDADAGASYPIAFAAPVARAAGLQGIDLARIPAFAVEIETTRDQATLRATEPVELQPAATAPPAATQSAETRFDSLVLLPLYRRDDADLSPRTLQQRQADHLGFAVAALRLDRLLASTAANIDLGGQVLELLPEPPADTAAVPVRGRIMLEPWRRPIPLAGRLWWLVGRPTADYAATPAFVPVWAVPTAGMVFTVLLGAYLHTLSNRTRRVQGLVARRTVELEDANETLAREIDERRRTEKALGESEERHRAVVQHAADGITLVDADTLQMIEVNEAFARLLGYTRDELLGRRVSELIVDTPEGVAARAAQTLGTAAPVVTRRQYRRKDGSVVDTEKSATVLDLGGRRVLCTVVHDVTDRKRAEEKLSAERNLLRTLIDNLPDRIYVKDAQGRYVLDNAAHLRQVGRSDVQEIIGKTVYDFFPHDVAERLELDDRRVMQSKQPLLEREEQIIDRQGAPRWLLTTKVPLVSDHGDVTGLVGVSRDITDRKRDEEVIRASEERTRLIVETALDAFVAMDAQGVIRGWNAQAETTFGWSRDEAIGRVLADTIVPPQHRAAHAAGIEHFLRSGEGPVLNQRIELTALRRDGHEFPVELTISPLRMGDSYIFNAFVHDITERKRAERELRDKHRQLEETIEKLKETQGALVQSEKLAGLGQMVAGVAHEINNPLAFVSNNVAVLQRDVRGLCDLVKLYAKADELLAQHRAELLAQIREQAERMDLAYTLQNLADMMARSRDGLGRIQQIVKDLREFARLDKGDLQEVSLNGGIESTVNIVRGLAKKKQVTLEVDLADLPPIACHPAKINQVIMNLITNAIDASDAGGTVTLRAAHDRSADVLRIEVIDQGHGIAPEARVRIFDPFYTTKPIGKGTGLGLSISYGIVQEHGGTIEVQSEVGKGSRFIVTLPYRKSAMTDQMQPQSHRDAEAEAGAVRKPR